MLVTNTAYTLVVNMNKTVLLDTRLHTQEPEITFIVPVFNTAHYLVETLNSIAAENLAGIELIIVNDGSTDDSLDVIEAWIAYRKLPVLLLNQPNAGLSAARMAGLAHAQGRFVGFCDSDDRIEISTYCELAKIATANACDVALCRSVVLNNSTNSVFDFYDSELWQHILAGKSFLITNVIREPRLLRLEPNANTRLLRRSFISEANISFPNGLHFEDLPPHIIALSKASKVCLLDATGYFYRVNRVGKITDQKSAKRFDILECAGQTFEFTENALLTTEARAISLALTCRMIYWCGTNTLNADRQRFFIQATTLIQNRIPSMVIEECINKWTDERESILVAALATNSVGILSAFSNHKQMPVIELIRLLANRRYGNVSRRVASRVLIQRIRGFMANFLSSDIRFCLS